MAGVQELGDARGETETYVQRDRELARFFLRRGFLRPGSRLLDVGSGNGHLIRVLRDEIPNLSIVSVEADQESLDWLRQHGFDAHRSLSDIPDGPLFDAVTMVEVIEHIDEPIEFLRGIRRLMAPDAKMFCTTPSGLKPDAYDTPEHVHFFTEKSLAGAVAQAGFSVIEYETVNEMTSALSAGAKRWMKDALRPIKNRVLGRVSLQGFAAA